MIKTVMFDLDGTLLPMEQDAFVEYYCGLLAEKAINCGYDHKLLLKTMFDSLTSMVNNDGKKTNEEVFWEVFVKVYGEAIKGEHRLFKDFYENEFEMAKCKCGYNPLAKEIIEKLKHKGYRLVLATNPVFPAIATKMRMAWAGLSPNDFELYTTIENSSHSKPNLEYYKYLLNYLDCEADECLMVGNDVDDDMVASSLGINTFLLTDCLINKGNKEISQYNKGSFLDLIKYLDQL